MGILARNLRTFPPSQRDDLDRVISRVRRRLDWNHDAVSVTTTNETTLASLTANANEVYVGTVLHLQTVGTITNSGTTLTVVPNFKLTINGTTGFEDAISVPDAGTDVVKVYKADFWIVYTTPAVLKLWGEVKISGDNATAPAVGTGTLESAQIRSAPVYHTLSSQHIARDQIIALTMTLDNATSRSATKQAAVLWAE